MRAALALVGSLGLHGLAALALVALLVPRPVPEQAGPPSRIEMAVMRVERAEAAERRPESAAAPGADAQGARVAGNVVPQRQAAPVAAQGARRQAVRDGARVAAVAPDAVAQGPVRVDRRVPAVVPQARVEAAVRDVAAVVPAVAARVPRIAPALGRAPQAPPVVTSAAVVQGVALPQPAVTAADPGARGAVAAVPNARAVTQVALPAERIGAGLAWSGAGDITLDAQSIAALQALLQPGAPQAQALRDSVAAVLAAPDCARIQTIFDERTGALELRGHIPDPDAAAPLVAALRSEMGAGLPLQENLRILPRPQCGVLDGIDRLGLPQSEEQLTDKQLIGENAHVREYAFAEGDRLVIDLVAPDYPAFVYVDYFDAEGQVIHLTPNEFLPLERHDAETAFAIGREGPLDLRIAPPFGQDIAVAFAASAPLYDGLRPVTEPAEAYLDWLRARVDEARAADPAFRGEWVYLFVATGPDAREN